MVFTTKTQDSWYLMIEVEHPTGIVQVYTQLIKANISP